MRPFVILIALLLAAELAGAQEAKKSAIPSPAAQAKIEKLLQELYADDFVKAEKDAAVRGRLAQTLLFEGKETKDPVGRYVLFARAHQLAAQAGDVNTALQAADELAQSFTIPAGVIFQMKIKMLQQAGDAKGATPDAYQSVIERTTALLEETLDADDFPSSLALIAAAEKAARKLQSLALVSSIRKRQEEIGRLQKEFARWQPFADKLAKDPQDAEARLEIGKYQALVKGNWERGLPLMAQGARSDLQRLAQSDFANPEADGARRVVALGWFTFATGTDADPAMRTQALLRSYHWYQQNLFDAKDDQRAQLEAKLQDIAAMLPAEFRVGEIAQEWKKIDVPAGPVYGCAFSPDGKRFVATGYDGTLRLFNARTYKEVFSFSAQAKIWNVAFAADGKRAVTGGFDNTVRLWDLFAGKPIKTFEGHKDYIRSVAMSRDGKWILSGGDDKTVRLWNVHDGAEQRRFLGHDHTVWCVALSHDGKRALSASLDKTVRLWEAGTGAPLKILKGHTDTVLCVAFTPDGRHAVSGSTDKTLRLWDLATGQTIKTFDGSSGYIHSVAVSPDGRRILSAGADGAVRLWDATTGKELRKLEGHRDQVWHVAFSRDGRFAISSGQDGAVRIWTGTR